MVSKTPVAVTPRPARCSKKWMASVLTAYKAKRPLRDETLGQYNKCIEEGYKP